MIEPRATVENAGTLADIPPFGRASRPDWSLVESHRPLAVRLARAYRGFRIPPEDLESEGVMGLVEASRRFDPAEGVKFATYASWWILKRIRQAASSQGALVRIPRHRLELHLRLRAAERELQSTLARRPTAEEVAARAGLAVDTVHAIRSEIPHAVSLDDPVSEHSTRRLEDVLSQTTMPSPDASVIEASRRACLDDLLPRLPARQRQVIVFRYGLDGSPPCSLATLAEYLGVSRERVHQIEQEAIRAMRAMIEPPVRCASA